MRVAKPAKNFWRRSWIILRKPDSGTFRKLPTLNRRIPHAVVRFRRGLSARFCAWTKLSCPSARKRGLQFGSLYAGRKHLELPLQPSQRKMKRSQGRARSAKVLLSLFEFQIHYLTHEPNR